MYVTILKPLKSEMLLLYYLLCSSHCQEQSVVEFHTIPVVTISLMSWLYRLSIIIAIDYVLHILHLYCIIIDIPF